MAKVIDRGWSTHSDQIAQPISILTGPNLKRPSDETSKPQKASDRSSEQQEGEKQIPDPNL